MGYNYLAVAKANCFDNSFIAGQTYDLRYAMLSNIERVTLDVGGAGAGAV